MAEKLELNKEATGQLEEIGKSFNRLMNQVEKSCIEDSFKKELLKQLQEMASDVHHLCPVIKVG